MMWLVLLVVFVVLVIILFKIMIRKLFKVVEVMLIFCIGDFVVLVVEEVFYFCLV